MRQSGIQAVAWDIDGTLIDSEPLHEEVLLEVCTRLGDDLSDLPEDTFRGVHIGDVWAALAPRFEDKITEAAWVEAIVERYVARASELVAIPDAVAVMQALNSAGVRQVCVSNSGRKIVDANIRALGIENLIEFSLSLDDVVRGKPDPFPYAEAARLLGVAPAEMAAVEDSETGATSGAAAGMRVFGIAPEGGEIAAAEVTLRHLSDVLKLIAESRA